MSSKHHRRLAAAVSTALLALSLVGPGVVHAAVPDLTDTWSVIPTTVQDDEFVAFRGSITNDDTSTVSQLYLVELVRDANLTLFSVTTTKGTCDATGATFTCTLGQLKPTKSVTVTAIYKSAVLVPAASYTAMGSWAFNTTGLGSGGGDNSHGDSWPSGTALTVNVNHTGDFGGRYVLNDALKIVENSQAIGNGNPHSTRAYSPVTGIGVTVEDIVCDGAPDDALCADLSAGFGQVSKINVNDGNDVSGTQGTTLLHFYLQFDSSELPNGVNANNLTILHTYPGGFEELTTACTFAKKSTIPNNAPCIKAKSLPGGDIGVDVWTFHNGGLRGNF